MRVTGRIFLVVMAFLTTSSQAQLSLNAGWNLVGNTTDRPINAATVFGSAGAPVTGVSGNISSVWVWDPAQARWQFYAPSLDAQALAAYAQSRNYSVLSSIPAGAGYWVNALSTLTVPLNGVVTSYTAASLVGELVTYNIDPVNLTYSYTIAESQYGLTGKTASGTLIKNADGTYSPSGISNGKIALLPNGVMIGAIRETFSGVTKTVPVYGFSNPVNSLADAQGTYNFVEYVCLQGNCATSYGTFRINSNGTWNSCPAGNLSTGCPGTIYSGTLSSIGNGKWLVMDGSTNVGTAFVFSSGGQNVFVVDMKDSRSAGFGIGMIVGSTTQAVDTSKTDGKWLALTTNGHWGIMTFSGTNIAYNVVDGIASTQTTSMTLNAPWPGIVTSVSGGRGILAGTGFYAYQSNSSGAYAEIGIKIQ